MTRPLLLALGRRGLVGQWLDQWFGVVLPFSTTGVVIAETFVAMPFLVVTVEAAFLIPFWLGLAAKLSHPELTGLEKFTDMGFLSAAMRTDGASSSARNAGLWHSVRWSNPVM